MSTDNKKRKSELQDRLHSQVLGLIEAERDALGLKKRDLAEKAGKRDTAYSVFLQGINSPSLATIAAYVEALGMDIEFSVKYKESDQPIL